MDDNVMRRYVVLADSPAEHVQFDQGMCRMQSAFIIMLFVLMWIRLCLTLGPLIFWPYWGHFASVIIARS